MSHREKEGGRNRSLVWLVAAAFCFPIPSVTLRVPRICSDQGYWEWIWHDRFVFFLQEVGWQHSNCSERTDQRGAGWQAGMCTSAQAKPVVLILWCWIENWLRRAESCSHHKGSVSAAFCPDDFLRCSWSSCSAFWSPCKGKQMRNRFQKARARTGGLQLCHYAANYKLTGLSRYKHICCWVRINKRIFCLLTRLFAEVSWAAVTKLDDWLPVHLAYPIQLPAFHLSLSWQMCLLRVWYWPAQLWLWCLWTLSLDSVILDFEVSFDASVFPVSVQTRNINVSNHPSFHFLLCKQWFLCFNTGFKNRLLGWDGHCLFRKASPAIPLLAAVAIDVYLFFSCDSTGSDFTFFPPYKVCCVEGIISVQTGR